MTKSPETLSVDKTGLKSYPPLLCFAWKFPTTGSPPPTPFVFHWRGYLRWWLGSFQGVTQFPWLSPMYSAGMHVIRFLLSSSCGHVWMWELDCEESWVLKNWCFWTMVLKKTVESRLDYKEIQPVHPKEDQSWVFIGRTDAEAETPILWPPYAKSWLIGKDPDAGRNLGQEEKGMTEDEMVGWHHQLNGHEFR